MFSRKSKASSYSCFCRNSPWCWSPCCLS